MAILLALSPLAGQQEMSGDLTREQILEHFPDWQEKVSSYSPDPQVIDRLRSLTDVVEIRVYLGTWCPDSKEHVSSFFKILDLVDKPNFIAVYIGLPRDKQARKPYLGQEIIERVPTFIIFRNGSERGRIIEHPDHSLEEDLINILESQPVTA